MIHIEELRPTDKDRKVVYRPSHGKMEEGRITSWNESFIFVDYDNTGRGQATKPEDLDFVS
jgi:hypothetical protein